MRWRGRGREGLMHKGMGFEGKVKGLGRVQQRRFGCWEKKKVGGKREAGDTVLF